jgi:hypothetical protein
LIESSDGRGLGYVQNTVDINTHRRTVVRSGDVRVGIVENRAAAGYAVKRRFVADTEDGSSGSCGKASEQNSVGLTLGTAETAFEQNVAVPRHRINPRINGQRVGCVQRRRVGNGDHTCKVAVELEGLRDFARRESGCSPQHSVIVVTGDVESVAIARQPRDHIRRRARTRRRRWWRRRLALARAVGVDDRLDLGLRKGAIKDFQFVNSSDKTLIGAADD